MSKHKKLPGIPLPDDRGRCVKAATLHVISPAQYPVAYTRSRASNCPVARVRLKAENDQLRQHVAVLAEEIRIEDTRTRRVPPHKRLHYTPTERMLIHELRAARAWSVQQTADLFLLAAYTIASSMKWIDEDGREAFVQIRDPVNKSPEFVRYAVRRPETLCPDLGKVKIAQRLCRAGVHPGATTVGRTLKEAPRSAPQKKEGFRLRFRFWLARSHPILVKSRGSGWKMRNLGWHLQLSLPPRSGALSARPSKDTVLTARGLVFRTRGAGCTRKLARRRTSRASGVFVQTSEWCGLRKLSTTTTERAVDRSPPVSERQLCPSDSVRQG